MYMQSQFLFRCGHSLSRLHLALHLTEGPLEAPSVQDAVEVSLSLPGHIQPPRALLERILDSVIVIISRHKLCWTLISVCLAVDIVNGVAGQWLRNSESERGDVVENNVRQIIKSTILIASEAADTVARQLDI